jgi:hypothetical protein
VTELGSLDLKIDLLINNAGLGLTGDFLSHHLAEELASIQVNVQALVGLSHALGAQMVREAQAASSIWHPIPRSSHFPIWRLRGSEGVRSPLQRSAKIRTPGTRRPGDGCLPRADGDGDLTAVFLGPFRGPLQRYASERHGCAALVRGAP